MPDLRKRTRQYVAYHLRFFARCTNIVIGALILWFLVDQVTNWPWQVTVAGVAVIALGTCRLYLVTR